MISARILTNVISPGAEQKGFGVAAEPTRCASKRASLITSRWWWIPVRRLSTSSSRTPVPETDVPGANSTGADKVRFFQANPSSGEA